MHVIYERGPWKYTVKYEPDPMQPSVSLYVISGSEKSQLIEGLLAVSWSPIMQKLVMRGQDNGRGIPLEAVEAFLAEARRLLESTSLHESGSE
jgi:hypothetical protein